MRTRSRARLLVEQLESRTLLSTYYVAPGGSNANAGTDSAPWATLQHAANQVRAGDTVIVRAGTYAGFDLWTDGTAASPIRFLADPGAVVNARNPRTADGINLEGADYVVIQGFEVTGVDRAGIRSVLNHHVTIRNNYSHHNGKWGILTGFSDDLLIENNVCTYARDEHGIYVSNSGDRPVIRNNVSAFNRANGIHMNGDASLGGDGVISNALVEGNTIYENGVGGGSGINCDGVQNSRIQNNLLYNNHASGISLYRIDGGGGSTGNVVVNNTVIVAADGRWALNIRDGSTGNTAYNNILYGYHSYRGSISVSADSLAGFVSDYNVVMERFTTDDGNSVKTLSQWRAATGQDTHSLVATPAALFVNVGANDYHLSATSPAIDRGTSLQAPLFDREDKSRPSGAAWDIGAYEYQSTTNSPPDAVNDPATTAEDTPVSVSVLANDADPDGDALSVTAFSQPANGTVTNLGGGVLRYSPRANFHGADSFTYTLSDGKGGTDTATVSVTVAPVNDSPSAVDDSASTGQGVPVNIDVKANDSDPDGDALSVSVQSGPANGSVSVDAAGRITYTPSAGFSGTDNFVYLLSDGKGGSDTATVTVTVTTASPPQDTVGLEADPWNAGKQALVVRGTSGDDRMTFASAASGTKVKVTVNGVARGTYLVSQISRILAYGRGGNDYVSVANALRVDAELHGEGGNDSLLGGGGNDLLLGELGDDRLEGRRGRNVFVGGGGADRLIGYGQTSTYSDGSDLLIGGSLTHESSPSSLAKIVGEWTSARTYAERTGRLAAGTDGLPRLDGSTVPDDGAADRMTGGVGSDWYFGTLPQDVLTDRLTSERLN